MAAGMWQGILAGYQSVEEKRAAREEKEEEILRRRRTVANTLRPQIQKNLQAVEEQKTMLSYLRTRGVEGEVLNAFSEDPETLKGAYEFAREGKGADLNPEQLADIYRVTRVGDVGPEDAFTKLQSMADIYRSFDQAEDPEAYMETLPLPTPRSTVVEVRSPVAEELGINPRLDSLYKLQESLFNRNVVAVARRDLNRKIAMKDRGELSREESATLESLTRDLDQFEKNPNSALEIRGIYGQLAMTELLNTEGLDPNIVAGIERNPYLFLIDEGEGAGFRTTPLVPVQQPEQPPPGTEFSDENFWFVPNPNGGWYEIPRRR